MNKKGFTLIELLAVIVILALLALLTTTSITKLVKDSKSDLSDIQIASIKASAEIWGSENISRLPGDGECKYITLKDLQDNGLIDSNVVNPSTTEQISNDLKIKITGESTSTGKIIRTYEVNPESIEGCKSIPNGDVNGDGMVNSQDAIDLSYYLFLEIAQNGSTLMYPNNGDMNSDDEITIEDINMISKQVGLVTSTIPDGTGLLGDVDGNGLLEELDFKLLMKSLGSVLESNIVLNNSDVNNDGEIDILDYLDLSRRINP